MKVHGFPCNPARHDALGAVLPPYGKSCPAAGVRGFTIVEILVAIVLAAFGILGFAGLLDVMGGVEAEETWRAKALFCAQERMEELTFAFVTGGAVPDQGQEDLGHGPYRGMRREWKVTDSGLFDGLVQVHVECAYPWKGVRKSIALSTLVFPED